MEWWSRLKPGDYYEADYEDDAVAHMRLALWPSTPKIWMVRSPDGDEWLEDVTGEDGATGPCRTRALRAGAGRGLAALYRFREELEGRELKTAIVRGLKAVIAQKPLEETPRVRQFNDGDETVSLEAAFGTSINPAMQAAVVRSRGRDAAAAPALPVHAEHWVATVGDSPGEEVWIACAAGPTKELGSQVALTPGTDLVFRGGRAMVQDRAVWLMAERVPAADAPALVEKLLHPRGRPGAGPEPVGAPAGAGRPVGHCRRRCPRRT